VFGVSLNVNVKFPEVFDSVLLVSITGAVGMVYTVLAKVAVLDVPTVFFATTLGRTPDAKRKAFSQSTLI